jgi:hypothetical protein
LPLNRVNFTGVADWVRTFSSTTVFNLRVSGNRYIEEARFQDGLGYDITQLGFVSGLSAQFPVPMFPRFELSDNIQLGRGSFAREVTNVYSIQPNLSKVIGSHTIRFGDGLATAAVRTPGGWQWRYAPDLRPNLHPEGLQPQRSIERQRDCRDAAWCAERW